MFEYKGQLFSGVTIAQSDTADINPPLKAIVVFTTGDLKFRDIQDTDRTFTFPTAANGGSYPFVLPCAAVRIFDTGTTLTDGNMLGLR